MDHEHPTTEATTEDPGMGGEHATGHMMCMTFHGGFTDTILFDGWASTEVGTFIASVFGILALTCLYEILKHYRDVYTARTKQNVQFQSARFCNQEGGTENTEPPKPKMFCKEHFIQTGLHAVQLTVSYLLMLIFMVYNVWICLAVIVGSTLGYFLFGYKKATNSDALYCH